MIDPMHWLATNKDSIEALFYLASLTAAFFAWWTYRRNAKTRRAEWLFSLYQKFFEEPHHKDVRFVLDYQPEPGLRNSRRPWKKTAPTPRSSNWWTT